jgi:F-type H+-transporting ATPase subunit gamma
MPSLKSLKLRITSVKSTRKITKAMQMVAAAKLRKAQENAEAARPYAVALSGVLSDVLSACRGDVSNVKLFSGTGSDSVHLLLVLTADRGLCGAFNGSIVRLVKEKITALQLAGKTVKLFCVGKKGRDVLKRDYNDLIIDFMPLSEVKSVNFEFAEKISGKILDLFDKGQFDICQMGYSTFQNVISQKPVLRQILPVPFSGNVQDSESAVNGFEPSAEHILMDLLPRNLTVQILAALLENAASEQGARMSAMDNATRNAGDMINKLTLQYNRTRQANITKELIEIISGAEAL